MLWAVALKLWSYFEFEIGVVVMKKIYLHFLLVCVGIGLCSCGKKEDYVEDIVSSTVETATDADVYNDTLEIITNDKVKNIEEVLKTISVEKVFEDISNIDLYLNPDFDEKKYTVETVEDAENDVEDVNYYSGETLVYTKYEGYGEDGFANYTRTASGLAAEVRYYTYSDDNRTVCIETDEYKVFANHLDKKDIYGVGDTNIVLFSKNEKNPFESSVEYYYDKGKATFENATYLENKSYQRYSFYIDEEGNEEEYTDVLVYADSPETSEDITNVLLSDDSYTYAAIKIGSGMKWYNADNKWYVETELAIVMEDEEPAKEYIKRNHLNGTVEDYGSIVVKIDDVILSIDENALLEEGKLPAFIIGDIDDSFFEKLTIDSEGVITKMEHAAISIY